MKKMDENLFKIGEIVKILGVTRKTILVYEEMGLLTPAVKDELSIANICILLPYCLSFHLLRTVIFR